MHNRANVLYFEPPYNEIIDRVISNSTKLISILTPFKRKLYILSMLMDDFPRTKQRQNFFNIMKNSAFILLFVLLSISILYFVRRQTRRVDISTVYLDVMMTTVGGGNLRFFDKWDKIICGILLFGAFLVNTICVDNFLYHAYLLGDANHMDSMDKLIKFNPPIFFSSVEFNDQNNSVYYIAR